MNDFYKGKNCIVTGASTGIGFGLSVKLLERGANVWLCSRTPANMEAAKEKLSRFGERAHFNTVDVRFADEITAYIQDITNNFPVDYLFNNAGIGYKGSFTDSTLKMWEDVMSVNLYGVVNGTYAVLPAMRKQGFGHIVNVSSVCGIAPLPYQTIYDASKYAVVGFSESLRYELMDTGVKVSVVCPGAVDTMIFKRSTDYVIHDDPRLKCPPESISPEQAGAEILEGVEAGLGIIPITDFARKVFADITKDPESNDTAMKTIKRMVEEEYAAYR